MDQITPQATPDPLRGSPEDHPNLTLRKKIRRIAGMILAAALIVVVVRGIYVATQAAKEITP